MIDCWAQTRPEGSLGFPPFCNIISVGRKTPSISIIELWNFDEQPVTMSLNLATITRSGRKPSVTCWNKWTSRTNRLRRTEMTRGYIHSLFSSPTSAVIWNGFSTTRDCTFATLTATRGWRTVTTNLRTHRNESY